MFVGLVIASTMTAESELKGDMPATHVKNLSEEFVERDEKFYKGQGWL